MRAANRFAYLLFLVLLIAKPASTQAPPAPPRLLSIPSGTIIPVVLRTSVAASKARPGQVIRAEVAQEVPLAGESKIRKGSKVEGTITEVIHGANGVGARLSIRFDKLYVRGQVIPLSTGLRAIAGFMAVLDASTPNMAIGEGDVADWMTTTQIGGDSVFGKGGEVTSVHDSGDVVGRSPISGGVLVQVRANPRGNCRGALNGDTRPQALWVFSSDACGTYGLSNVSISNAGRSDPVGVIRLDLTAPKTRIAAGAGLLLRVTGDVR